MKNPSLKLALDEFKDHKKVYLAIIIVVALCMTVFTTQSALNEYNDYVTDKTIKTMYGDGVVLASGTPLRNVVSGAPPMKDAGEIAKRINTIPGFRAVMRAEGEGGAVHKELEARNRAAAESDGGTYWGIDVKKDESVCSLRDKIVEGKYFDENITYTQAGMGAPGGLTLIRTPAAYYGEYSSSWEKYYSGAVKPYPVLVGRACASLHNLKLGEVFIGAWLTEQGVLYNDVYLEIIGIYETGKPVFEILNYIVPIESMQEVKGWDSQTANYICVKAPDGMSDDEIRENLIPVIGDRTFYSASQLKTIWEGNLGAVGKFILYVTIAASLLLAAAAVKYVMDSIIIRKIREIGTLKALGARDRVVVSIFLYQAFFIGIISAGLGLLTAVVVMSVLSYYGVSIPYVLGTKMEIKFILTPLTVFLAFIVPLIVASGAAAVPCLKVAHLSPVEAIRRGELQSTAAKIKKYSIGDWIKDRFFMGRINPFTIAFDEIRDHKVIYATIVVVIAVALSVFMLQSAYQEHFTQNMSGSLRDIICADGMILGETSSPRSMLGGAPQIENAVALAQEIEAKTGYRAVARSNNQNVVEFKRPDGTIIFDGGSFWGIDVKQDEEIMNLKKHIIKGEYFDPDKDYSQNVVGSTSQYIPGIQWGGIGTVIIMEQLEEPYPVLMGKAAAEAHDIDIGDIFTFLILNSKKGSGAVSAPFQVLGIYDTGMPVIDSVMYFTPREAINELMGYGPDDGNAIVVKASGNPDYRTIYATLQNAAPDMQAYSWHEAVLLLNGASFDALTLIIYTAIAVTLVLVGVSIKYAMDSTVDRKTREIGTFKAFGARDRFIVQIFIYQGIFIGIASGILAVILSYTAIYFAIHVFSIESQLPLGMVMKVGFVITSTMIAITLSAPFAASLIAAYTPSRSASKLSPVEALRKGELNL